MSNDVDEFLSHYGVKGMRWGVRRKRQSESNSANGSPSSNKSRKKKIAAGVAGAAIVGGAAATAIILNRNGQKSLKVAASKASGYNGARRLLLSKADLKIKNITQATDAGKITPTQATRLTKLANKQYDSSARRLAKKSGTVLQPKSLMPSVPRPKTVTPAQWNKILYDYGAT